MPVLVHLADERDAARIQRGGIKIGKYRQGVFCMPVLPNFYVSHQWLRELKRGGARTFVGVYFRLASKTLVYAGKYNREHRHVPLGEAIREIMSLDDPLGYELIIDRKIEPREIEKIRNLPQTLGWRYIPSSHQEKPSCVCRVCIPPGSIKSRRLREKLQPPVKALAYDEILLQLQVAENERAIENLLWDIGRIRRRADPTALLFLLERNSPSIDQVVAATLSVYRHKNTRGILLGLLNSSDDDTREFASDSLLQLYGQDVEQELLARNDVIINRTIDEWKSTS